MVQSPTKSPPHGAAAGQVEPPLFPAAASLPAPLELLEPLEPELERPPSPAPAFEPEPPLELGPPPVGAPPAPAPSDEPPQAQASKANKNAALEPRLKFSNAYASRISSIAGHVAE